MSCRPGVQLDGLQSLQKLNVVVDDNGEGNPPESLDERSTLPPRCRAAEAAGRGLQARVGCDCRPLQQGGGPAIFTGSQL